MSSTYTEDDLKTAVAVAVQEATAALTAKLEAYESADAEAATEAKIAEAVAAKEAEIAELQGKLDTASLEAETAKQEMTDLVAFLQAEVAAAAEAAAVEERRNERLEAVKEFAFTEEMIAERIDRWAAMDEEAFTALLDDWKAVATKKPETKSTELPKETAFTANRESETTVHDARAEVLGLRGRGVDVRKV